MQFSDEGEDKGHYGVIDLGNIEEKEWVQNIAKEEGNEKSIPMHMSDLIDFVTTAKASFVVFKIKINLSLSLCI